MKTVKIDFVSDIACPWCAVGLGALEQALTQLGDRIQVELHFQPFELNPQMPMGGQDVIEHLVEKYGVGPKQVRENQAQIRKRAAEVGFAFHPEGRKWVYNTFDCHRLLHWVGLEFGSAAQHRLKRELLGTYFTLAVNLDDPSNMLDAVDRVGLDRLRAQEVLASDEFKEAVREQQKYYLDAGIHSVPAVILNDQILVQGAQPVEQFVAAILQASNAG
jgi:predicted DsbA family dithiol-disulfide isomerase